jgi:hypothetical protein
MLDLPRFGDRQDFGAPSVWRSGLASGEWGVGSGGGDGIITTQKNLETTLLRFSSLSHDKGSDRPFVCPHPGRAGDIRGISTNRVKFLDVKHALVPDKHDLSFLVVSNQDRSSSPSYVCVSYSHCLRSAFIIRIIQQRKLSSRQVQRDTSLI